MLGLQVRVEDTAQFPKELWNYLPFLFPKLRSLPWAPLEVIQHLFMQLRRLVLSIPPPAEHREFEVITLMDEAISNNMFSVLEDIAVVLWDE